MARLVYSAITSLDGYVADRGGRFDWCMPDEEVHTAVNDLMRPIRTHLYGRRMYEVMTAWDTVPTDEGPAPMRDFASLWRAADKVVHSRTLTSVDGPRTRLEPAFDPDAVRALKASSATDLLVAGPTLAGQAFAAGLVDDVHLFVSPVVVGGGLAALPTDSLLRLELVQERRFRGGVMHLGYRVTDPGGRPATGGARSPVRA